MGADRAPVVVIGLGNVLMADDGIGVHLLREVERQWRRWEQGPQHAVAFEDLGTAGLSILHALAGRRKAILLDSALMEEPPGTIRRFTPEQVDSRKRLSGVSLHEGDLLKILDLSRSLGECPADVVIFGIQPASVAPGDSLSAIVSERLPEYADLVLGELRRGK